MYFVPEKLKLYVPSVEASAFFSITYLTVTLRSPVDGSSGPTVTLQSLYSAGVPGAPNAPARYVELFFILSSLILNASYVYTTSTLSAPVYMKLELLSEANVVPSATTEIAALL